MIILVLISPASAAVFTWDGGSGVDSDWTSGANWAGNVSPPSNGTADIVMAGLIRTTPNVDAAWDILSLTFNNTAGPFTLGGSTLTIGTGGVVNNDTGLQTINNAITLGFAQNWNAASGDLLFNGNVNNNGYPLYVNGSNDTTITGAISGIAGLLKNGTGTLTFSGGTINSYSAGTTVNEGTLLLNRTSSNGAIHGDLIVGNSAGGIRRRRGSTPGRRSDFCHWGQLRHGNQFRSIGFQWPLRLHLGLCAQRRPRYHRSRNHLFFGSLTTNASTQAAVIEGNLNIGSSTRTFTVNDGTALVDLEIYAALGNSAAGAGLTKTGTGYFAVPRLGEQHLRRFDHRFRWHLEFE